MKGKNTVFVIVPKANKVFYIVIIITTSIMIIILFFLFLAFYRFLFQQLQLKNLLDAFIYLTYRWGRGWDGDFDVYLKVSPHQTKS